MLVSVVIPALNESGNIGRLVTELNHVASREFPRGVRITILVADNGSTDNTAREARRAGAHVVAEARRGYGFACAAGAQAASDADVLVFLDGDYSSLPKELPRILEPLLLDQADLVLGSRTRGFVASGAMPFHQRFGNWLASSLMRLLYGMVVTDLGPFRAIRRPLLESLKMREMTYGWPTEMMVKTAKKGARIVEVPVSFHPRQAGDSKVSGTLSGTILAAYRILAVTLRYAWMDGQ